MPSQESGLRVEFLKSRGVATFDDDAESVDPRRTLEPHHELVVVVEYCTAPRPSRIGSLRGSAEKYTNCFALLDEALQPLKGEELRSNGWVMFIFDQ